MAEPVKVILRKRGYMEADKDYPNFKDKATLKALHGPAYRDGYLEYVYEANAVEEEMAFEAANERAAERHYEEGPHGSFYDDPRGN